MLNEAFNYIKGSNFLIYDLDFLLTYLHLLL
jgi:hypothetical protein